MKYTFNSVAGEVAFEQALIALFQEYVAYGAFTNNVNTDSLTGFIGWYTRNTKNIKLDTNT